MRSSNNEWNRQILLLSSNAPLGRSCEPRSAFAARTEQEWAKIFSDSDACVAPVLGMADAPGHPQLLARNTFFVNNGISQPAPAPGSRAPPHR
jgi:crotonobetainyl-CoA:carnitine CoA-transferase CaiB-like acyl-CoA transferase